MPRTDGYGRFRSLCEEHWKERIRHNYRVYARSHRAKCVQKTARYRARKLNQFIEDVDPAVVYVMHGGMCGICKEFVAEDDFHVDHVIPLSRGGMHGYINVQPAHPICNQRKGNK